MKATGGRIPFLSMEGAQPCALPPKRASCPSPAAEQHSLGRGEAAGCYCPMILDLQPFSYERKQQRPRLRLEYVSWKRWPAWMTPCRGHLPRDSDGLRRLVVWIRTVCMPVVWQLMTKPRNSMSFDIQSAHQPSNASPASRLAKSPDPLALRGMFG